MLASILLSTALAIDLDLNNQDSVHSAAEKLTKGVMDYYDGNHEGGTVGVMSPPYYWWESASAFNGLFTYGLVTGDDQYEDMLHQSLMAQSGKDWDFITENQTMVEGNDDQGYWAIFAMEAAERNFKAPDNGKQWVDLAKNVFDQMTTRWDPECGGGLRWQIYDWNAGYNYKNSVSTGCMFNLAARLARYTNNQTYVDWAYKIYEWMTDVKLIVEPSSQSVYHLYDGAGTESMCKEISTAEWSYNYGLFLSGMAYLHDLMESDTWSKRVDMAWTRAAQIFFQHDDTNAMLEPSCQPHGACNNDQRSFRAAFSRFLSHLMIFMPEYQDKVLPLLQDNANNAAKSCSGGSDGITCGQDWSKGSWDGVYGLGEEMSALDVLISTQSFKLGKPMTNPTSDDKPSEPQQYLAASDSSSSSSQSSSESSTQASSSESSTQASSTEASSTEASTEASTESSTESSPTESSTESSTEASSTEAASTEAPSSSESAHPDSSSSKPESSSSSTHPDSSSSSSKPESSSSSSRPESSSSSKPESSSSSQASSSSQVTTTSAASSSSEEAATSQAPTSASATASSSNAGYALRLPGSILSLFMAFVL